MSEFKVILEPIAELLEKKNKDYGNSYYLLRDEFGPMAFYVRIMDKYHRIRQLDQAGAKVTNESVLDTLVDLIGYCTLEIKYRQRWKCNDLT